MGPPRLLCAMGSTQAYALFTLCVLLREVACFNLTIADLPPTTQLTSRLLVAITVSDSKGVHFVTKQLQSYAEACELGFEVHVVLVSFASIWDNQDSTLFPTETKYYCLRIHMLLPVVVASFPPNLGPRQGPNHGLLAHQHRFIFSQLADHYDLFLSQEHDMHIRARHILYWTRWRRIFKQSPTIPHSDRPLIPGFLRHEVSMRHLDAANPWKHPAALVHHCAPLTIIHVGNVTAFLPFKSFPGFYLIDRELLQLAMSKQAWTTDLHKKYFEFNTHHQSMWQWYYFHQAIPLTAVFAAMVHHGSDKYAKRGIDSTSTYNASDLRPSIQDGGEPMELAYLVTHCMGQPWDGTKLPHAYPSLQGNNTVVDYAWCRGWFPSNFRYTHLQDPSQRGDHPRCSKLDPAAASSSVTSPCAQCISQGKGAAIIYQMAGPTLAAQPTRPTGLIHVDVQCMDRLAVHEMSACLDAGCQDYYVPVVEGAVQRG